MTFYRTMAFRSSTIARLRTQASDQLPAQPPQPRAQPLQPMEADYQALLASESPVMNSEAMSILPRFSHTSGADPETHQVPPHVIAFMEQNREHLQRVVQGKMGSVLFLHRVRVHYSITAYRSIVVCAWLDRRATSLYTLHTLHLWSFAVVPQKETVSSTGGGIYPGSTTGSKCFYSDSSSCGTWYCRPPNPSTGRLL